jgi:hypothetical protein
MTVSGIISYGWQSSRAYLRERCKARTIDGKRAVTGQMFAIHQRSTARILHILYEPLLTYCLLPQYPTNTHLPHTTHRPHTHHRHSTKKSHTSQTDMNTLKETAR